LSESRLAGLSYYLEGPEGREPLHASYDEDADVLYLWRGERPVEALSLETDEGPIVRLDLESGELCGVTLIDWNVMWAKKKRIELHVPSVGASERAAATEKPVARELVAVAG
jgi:hypothetical protein